MYNQALEIHKEVSDPKHPDLGQSYGNLATVLHELGENDQALKNYQVAIRILESSPSEDSQDLFHRFSQLRITDAGYGQGAQSSLH